MISHPSDLACGSKTYDFFIVSRCLSASVFAVRTFTDGAFKPHFPVRLLLRASLRSLRVRKLVAPKGFEAALLFGPPTLQAVTASRVAGATIAAERPTASLDVDQ